MRRVPLILLAAVVAAACGDSDLRSLDPLPNPAVDDPQYAPQPNRDHPREIVVAAGVAWVSLPGAPDDPGEHIARVDLATGKVRKIRVGRTPTGLALHPDGEVLLVFNSTSNWVSIVDTRRGREVQRIATDFYAGEGAFSEGGDQVWFTNRWTDSVVGWRVSVQDGRVEVMDIVQVAVGPNPRDLAISPDGMTIAVASTTDLTVSLIDTSSVTERARVSLGSPANGLAWVGPWLIVPTTSASTHHHAFAGPDTDGDGNPGDGTPNINFQDLQNDIAVLDRDGLVAFRATSDSICCKDYRDVSPDDAERFGNLLPPVNTWIVGGALPEQVVADDDAVYVTYSGSNQVQRFGVDAETGRLSAGAVGSTGHGPHGLAIAGGEVLVVDRLGETVGRHDPITLERTGEFVVGDVSEGVFPATDAEIGELINQVTAPFSVDGDLSCTACHRDDGNVDKAFSMPLTRESGVGLRMTMAYRAAGDTRPWFHEAAMDHTNFKPVLNELARIENFCCTDPTLWPNGAPADCTSNPPPECSDTSPGSSNGDDVVRGRGFEAGRPTRFASRDAFISDAALTLIGRDQTFGDAVSDLDPITGDRLPRKLDFDGITRSIGAFLVTEPRLLPNPNDAESGSAQRGRVLFERLDVGCVTCHPAPTFAVSESNNPFDLPLRMAPVVTPYRAADGTDLDALAPGFIDTFPDAEDGRFGVPTLRGIWDRAPSMLHHGQATGLREVVCTPGHPALRPTERGFNEIDGVPDTHGGTSHLNASEVDDLIAYMESL